jgi:glycosyltransferase involved in cell wall biosynthesis
VHNNQPVKQLLTVASLRPIKGIPNLLRALSLLRERRSDFSLTIVGGGDHREEYQELSDQLGLGKYVHFVGIKMKGEIAHLMRSSNLFVLPSLYENLPCVLLEAMACGLPIVSTTVGGISEIVNEERGVLVEPGNPEKLAEAIDYVLEHGQQWSREKIASYVQEHFSYEAVGKKLTNIYQEVKRKQV